VFGVVLLNLLRIALMLGGRWLLIAVLVSQGARWLGAAQRDLRTYLSVVAMAETVYVLQMFAARLAADGVGAIAHTPPLALSQFIAVASPLGAAFLAGISPFSIWYAVVLVIGLRSAAAVPLRVAASVALVVWSVGVGAQFVLL
jgi:hypothetical protein